MFTTARAGKAERMSAAGRVADVLRSVASSVAPSSTAKVREAANPSRVPLYSKDTLSVPFDTMVSPVYDEYPATSNVPSPSFTRPPTFDAARPFAHVTSPAPVSTDTALALSFTRAE